MIKPIVVPRSSKYGSNYWISKGPKVDMREVILYSDLEFDNWLWVETNPDIETYCEQYPEISYVFDGKLHTSIFDMWIKFRNGIVRCCEVKYETELDPGDPRNCRTIRQIKAQSDWCEQNNIEYEVITEKHLRMSRYGLENRLKIISVINNISEPQHLAQITKLIGKERISLQTLSIQANKSYQIIHDICLWLFYKGAINANIDESIICKQSEVWLRESDKNY